MTTETFNYDRICKVVWAGEDIDGKVFVEIRYDNLLNPTRPPCLSLTGVIGPKRNGDSKGSCGQILPDVGESCTWRPTGDLNKGQLDQLLFAWRRWHLNTMRAGCEHQRAEGWEQRPIDPTKPLNTYGRHVPGSTATTWNMLTWVSPSEHPDGLLGVPCPTCGYKFGTAWQHEEVPYEVLDFLRSLPECSITYPWQDSFDRNTP